MFLQVKLGFRKQLDEAGEDRQALYDSLLQQAYEMGKGLRVARNFELDEIIDPAETRSWVMTMLRTARPQPRATRKHFVDTW